ncbi:MAG: NAD(P)/FAD-dependent oxidoreductase [Paramuribaculum sp.]|nr:NAD(P)/FAD-dependent oxidoreductase [Paramuribaculum sp.]
MERKQKIVVIGGGFAGLNFLKKIDKNRFDVLLVDKNNYHSFPPLFYQIASGGLDPASISFPFRREMRKKPVRGTRFHLGKVKTIDVEAKTVQTQFETIPYDKLVIAAGTTNNFFGNSELIKYVYTLKSAAEAIRCRDEVLDRLERASLTKDKELRRRLLSFVVIGGGPTGVEVAGALGEMKRDIITREYPDLEVDEVNITLLEGSDRLLGAMTRESSDDALRYLDRLMVDVKLGHLMKEYSDNVVTLEDGTRLEAGMVIWTAGITGTGFQIEGTDVKSGPGNRFVVDRNSAVVGIPDVYALGDIAFMTSPDFPKGMPQLAQVAIQQARHLAEVLNADGKKEIKPFEYNDKGSMATVGRNLAVADLYKIHLSGRPAWFTWMFIHLISILGMRNKVTVLINWIWAYFTYSTSLRLLIHTTRYPLRSRWGER